MPGCKSLYCGVVFSVRCKANLVYHWYLSLDEAFEKLHRFASTLMNLLDGHKKKNLPEKPITGKPYYIQSLLFCFTIWF